MRDADRLQVLHRRAKLPAGNFLVAVEPDVADFDLRSFLNNEVDANCRWRNFVNLSADGCELTTMFSKQVLQDDFGVLDLGRIVLALLRKADLLFLKAVEDVAICDRIQTDVLDLANRGLFRDVDVDDHAFLRVFALEADVVEVACIPERIEVAFQRLRIVNVARPGKHASSDGIGGYASLAVNVDLGNKRLLRAKSGTAEQKPEHYQQTQAANQA